MLSKCSKSLLVPVITMFAKSLNFKIRFDQNSSLKCLVCQVVKGDKTTVFFELSIFFKKQDYSFVCIQHRLNEKQVQDFYI